MVGRYFGSRSTGTTRRMLSLAALVAATALLGDAATPAVSAAEIAPLQQKINTAKEKAIKYLLSLQQDKLLIVQGSGKDANAKYIEVDAEFKDVTIITDPVTRRPTDTIKVKGQEYKDVSAILPPGWFKPDPVENRGHHLDGVGGATSLVTLALLTAGISPVNDKRMERAVMSVLYLHTRMDLPDSMFRPAGTPDPKNAKKAAGKPEGGLYPGTTMTYALGIHCTALEMAMRYLKNRRNEIVSAIQKQLNFNGKLLEQGVATDSGYHYHMFDQSYDMSCTQYGILGLWACARAGVELSDKIWQHFNRWLLDKQTREGGWSYSDAQQAKDTMTEAGIASLFLCMDYLHTRTRGTRGPDVTPFSNDPLLSRTVQAIERGFEYFGPRYKPSNSGYYMYGAERIGVASGYKYFGNKDWFRQGAELLTKSQQGDGSWGGGRTKILETSWNLMFLVYGSAPVLINKLAHGPKGDMQFWHNYPRDAANLAGWFAREFEQLVSWQVLDIRTARVDEDLLDAPITYISGYKKLEFTDEEVDKLRLYVEKGGTLLFVAAGNKKEYLDSVMELGNRLYSSERFPDYQFTECPRTHPVFTINQVGKTSPLGRLPLMHMSNGHRSFAFLVPIDIAYAWHTNRASAPDTKAFFLFIANLKNYCTDKGFLPDKIRPTLTQGETKTGKAGRAIEVGLASYKSKGKVEYQPKVGAGKPTLVEVKNDWASSPDSYRTMNAWLKHVAGTEIKETRGVSLTDRELLKNLDVVHMTGHYAFELSTEEVKGLQDFVTGGGLILLEPTGGTNSEFYQSAIEALRKVFPDDRADTIPISHPIITGQGLSGRNVTEGSFSRNVKLTLGNLRSPAERLKVIKKGDRVAAIVTPLDVSVGIAGQDCWERTGLATKTARELMANVLLYARDNRGAGSPTKPTDKPNPNAAPNGAGINASPTGSQK